MRALQHAPSDAWVDSVQTVFCDLWGKQMSCCNFFDFKDDFDFYFKKLFDASPSHTQVKRAKRDWRAGSTGYEAACIAMDLQKEADRKASEVALVNIGGNNWAHEGSNLAVKYQGLQK